MDWNWRRGSGEEERFEGEGGMGVGEEGGGWGWRWRWGTGGGRMVGGQGEMGGGGKGEGTKGSGMKGRRWREGRKGGGRKMKRKVMNNVRKSRGNKNTVSTHYYDSCAHCTSPPHSLVPRKWGLGTRLLTSVTTQLQHYSYSGTTSLFHLPVHTW